MTTIHHDIQAIPVRHIERKWMTRKGAAEYLGISVKYVARLNALGIVPGHKVNGLVFVKVDDIDRVIERSML